MSHLTVKRISMCSSAMKLYIVLLTMCIYSTSLVAQYDKLRTAFEYAKSGNSLDSARLLIDQTCKNQETMNDAQTWYLKSYIYREVYKKQGPHEKELQLIRDAFQASLKSIEIDPTSDNKTKNLILTKGLRVLVQNTFLELQDTAFFEQAVQCIQLQKQLVTSINPHANADSVDVFYYYVLGSKFQADYESEIQKKSKLLLLAKECYNKVLISDPNNISANFNMGLIYYNEGVGLIMKNLRYDADLTTINIIQDEAVIQFRKARPYMEKAYQLNPNKKETIIALSGIYYSLHETELFQQFQKLLPE